MLSLPSGLDQTVVSDLHEIHISPVKRSLFLKACGTEDGDNVGHRNKGKNSNFHIVAALKFLTLQSLFGKGLSVHLWLAFIALTL